MADFFELKARGTDVKTEILAGITTFMTMGYILAVNPGILSATGMDWGALFTATALASIVGTVAMGFLGRMPFALAPGMGLNAFFAFTVCGAMGYSWQFALTAVFLEGIIFIILTAFNIREAIVDCIPKNIKKSISVGIGLFIALIGLHEAGVVMGVTSYKPDPEAPFGVVEQVEIAKTLPPVRLGSLSDPTVLVCLIGLVIGGILVAKRVKGALLITIFVSAVIGIPFGVTTIPDNFSPMRMPASISPIFFKFQFGQIFSLDMLIVLFTFLFVDMFDTIGTLIGVTTKAGMLDEQGKVPRIKGALFADAIGTTVGAMLGTSTVTTYVESAAGVEEGGRSGLTAFVVAALFGISLFFSPLFGLISPAATAPALVLVGVFMMSPIKDLEFGDYSELIPAFLCLFMMPMAYSIADGIAFGMVSYILLKAGSGKTKDVPAITYIVGILFFMNFVVKVIM